MTVGVNLGKSFALEVEVFSVHFSSSRKDGKLRLKPPTVPHNFGAIFARYVAKQRYPPRKRRAQGVGPSGHHSDLNRFFFLVNARTNAKQGSFIL